MPLLRLLTRSMVEQARSDLASGSLLGWMFAARSLLAEGVPFDLGRHLYLKDIYKDTAPEMIVMKSGQAGVSEYCVSRALWSCDRRGMNVLYLLPTLGDIGDFSQMRIGTAIEASAYLRDVVIEGRQDGKRGSDRVMLKRVRDRWLVLRGTQVKLGAAQRERRTGAARLKTVPVDLVIYDEFDEMPAGIEALASKRLGHSEHKEQLWVSTPTYPGMGIHAKWLESDQRRWFVPCPSCSHRQTLTLEHVVIEWDDLERPAAWHGQGEERAYCACEQCGAEVDRLAAGEWVAAHPGRSLVGYTINKLATAQNDPLDVVKGFLAVDESKRQEAFNQDLALPYKPRGGGLSDDVLDACMREYAHGVVPGERCFMGVDVGRVLSVVIRGPANVNTGELPQRYAGEVPNFEDLGRLIRQYNVVTCVVDALPETRKAREFQQALPQVVWLAYYGGAGLEKAGAPVAWKVDTAVMPNGERMRCGTISIDRTRILDEAFARMYDQTHTLPGHIRALGNYYDQMKAPLRITEDDRTGNAVARYVETGADHYAHAEAYCTAALMRREQYTASMERYI